MIEIVIAEFENWKSVYRADHKMSERTYYKAQGVFNALADMADTLDREDVGIDIEEYAYSLKMED